MKLVAHYVIVYGAIYGLVYDVPGFSVHFDTCADSVYQAVFFFSSLSNGLGTKLHAQVLVCIIIMPRCACAAKHTVVTLCVCVCVFVPSASAFSVDFGHR